MYKSLSIFCLLQLSIVLSVEGVSMTINPSSMVVGSSSANPVTRVEFGCFSDGTDNIEAIYRLEISRKRSSDLDFVNIAVIDDYKIIKIFPPDMRSPNATGNFVHVAAGGPPTSGTLVVTIDGGGLTCSDQAEFKCTMTYKMMRTTTTAPVSHSNHFTVITAPNDVRIIDARYEENGVMKRLDNDKSLKVGTRIMYRCSANIGSDSNVPISWERSSVMGTSTDFVPYIPVEPTDIVQDPVISTNCSNTRTSSMYYNLTSSDKDGITFHCKVQSYLRGELYQSTSIQHRTVAVLSGGSEKTTVQPGANTVGSDVLAVVLGVLLGACVVLVAILSVCLHRYRKLAEELQWHPQNDNLNAYDRLNMAVGHSQTYDMLERNNSDGRVPEANSMYVNVEHNDAMNSITIFPQY